MKRYPCYGTYDQDGYACINACHLWPGCSKLTETISSIKHKSLDQLATYLADNEPLIREAAKERFDELTKI